MTNTFAERFRELKEKRGLTFTEIAKELGIGVRAVQRYAYGEGYPRFSTLDKLLQLFGKDDFKYLTAACIGKEK